MKELIKANSYIDNIRAYKVASHEVWIVEEEDREKILKLDWNEATIHPSPRVIERLKQLANRGDFYNLYPQTNNEILMNAIAGYVELPKEYVQIFASSDVIHEYISRTFLNEHSRVLIQSPSYDNFRLTAEASGAEIIYSNLSQEFMFQNNLFEIDIDNYRPKMVYICNPNNPTGLLHRIEYIEKLLRSYPEMIFLIDEAYWEFSGSTVKDLAKQYHNLLITRTFSKAFGLANFRIGYLISNPENIELINKIRNPKNISTFAQEAAFAALSDVEYMWSYVEEIKKTREWFFGQLNQIGIGDAYRSYGNFILFKCRSAECKHRMIEYLKKNGIYVRDITHSPTVLNCVRITVGTREQMIRVMESIRTFAREYKER